MLTQADVVQQMRTIYEPVQRLANDLTPAQMAMETAPGVWTIKDHIAHLAFWDRNFANLIKTALKLEPREVLSGTLDEINAQAHAEHHRDSAEKVMDNLAQALESLIRAVGHFSDEQLNAPGMFDIAKGQSLADYILDEVRGHFSTHLNELQKLKAQIAGA